MVVYDADMKKTMSIGFYTKFPKGSLFNQNSIVYGDELYAESLCRALRDIPGVEHAKLYAPNDMPDKMVDCMIYLNDNKPLESASRCRVLYLQNPYFEGSLVALKRIRKYGYDGELYVSQKLLKLQKNVVKHAAWLPFSVDTNVYYPRQTNIKLAFQVSYIGNDYKELDRTKQFLLPALRFNFGLYGKWGDAGLYQLFGRQIPALAWLRTKYRIWKAKRTVAHLSWQELLNRSDLLYRIARGKIPQEDVPSLYSSSEINLNYTAKDHIVWQVLTLRSLEIMACGGFLLTDADFLMKDNKFKNCLIVSKGGKELEKQVKYYLDNSKERQQIANRGHELVKKHYSSSIASERLVRFITQVLESRESIK